jgi:AraC family transcriptional regulator
MGHRIRVEARDAVLVISKRRIIALDGVGPMIGETFGELYGHLAMYGVAPAGPPFLVCHSMPLPDGTMDVEVCAPIARPVDPPPGCGVGYVPGGTFATLVHRGPYDTIGGAYEELASWAGRHHRDLVGPPREVYLSEPGTRPADVRTMVEWPVSEVRVPVDLTS